MTISDIAPTRLTQVASVCTNTNGQSAERDLIFISHANPEENEFVTWLSAKLSLAGYKTWCDVNELVGGELFWEDIEKVIREQAAKVVFVQSKTALKKPNVLNELDLALSVERAINSDRFVVPIKIDGSEFDRTYIGLRRRLIIDFKEKWSDGLSRLLTRLEKDNVAKTAPLSIDLQSSFSSALRARSSDQIREEPSTLYSNWFEFHSIPRTIKFYSVEGISLGDMPKFTASLAVPCFNWHKLLGTFADWPILQENLPSFVSASPRLEISLDNFLAGQIGDLPSMSRGDSRRLLVSLVGKSWRRRMEELELNSYELSSGRLAWFVTNEKLPDGYARFMDGEKFRRRQIIGYSDKYKAYWHFAVEPWAAVDPNVMMTFRPTVVFSEDGITPLDRPALMHRLRRSFCKSWWNDRWRDLIRAYASYLADEETLIRIPSYSEEELALSALPVEFQLPVTFDENADYLSRVYHDDDDFEDEVDFEDFSDEELVNENDDEGDK